MKRLVIISSPDGASEDERLSELATFLGVAAEILPVTRDGSSAQELLNRVRPGPCCLAMHLETLRQLHRTLRPGTSLPQLLHDRFSKVLVYGVAAAGETLGSVKALTDGAICGLGFEPFKNVRYSLSHEARELCAQLAGQSLTTTREHAAPTLEIRSGRGSVETIMAAGERPIFVRLKTATGDIFLLAGCMPDLSKQVSEEIGLGDDCIPLLPLLMFLRHCFPEHCWRGDAATARLTIDDPLLTKNYGALDFEALKASMRRLGYGASVAFIPWNHWRTSRRSAARLFCADSNLSICIHGCDHTNHEFRLGPASRLMRKAVLGIERMEKHRSRVGVPFDDVMVFPQGQFSKAAMQALRSANYLAAVNSNCFPYDCRPGDLKIADYLWPAVTCFNGFPIFQRRYPPNRFEIALDLFLGKPALLVEHHEFFGDGGKAMEEFVAALQAIEPRLSWPGLTAQLMRSNLRRRAGADCTEVRFFTRRFQLVGRNEDGSRYLLSKPEPDPNMVQDVRIDGRRVPFGFDDGLLKFEIENDEAEPRNIEILDRETPPLRVRSFGIAYNARVLVRRSLSEFRDKALWRHKGALRIARKLARTIKATADS